MGSSSVVELAAHQFEAAPGDPIGPVVLAGDGLAASELLEQRERQRRQPPAVAVVEIEGVDAAGVIADRLDAAALGENVQHAERVTTEFVLGRRVDAWDVYTDQHRWWVITSPTNLYSQELFPSLDYAISFHVGVTARIMSEPDSGVSETVQSMMASAWRQMPPHW